MAALGCMQPNCLSNPARILAVETLTREDVAGIKHDRPFLDCPEYRFPNGPFGK